jgi:hypothetical protein
VFIFGAFLCGWGRPLLLLVLSQKTHDQFVFVFGQHLVLPHSKVGKLEPAAFNFVGKFHELRRTTRQGLLEGISH